MSRRYRRRSPDDWDHPPSPRCAYAPSPTPSPPFLADPPFLHITGELSAEAATRLLLTKWDMMDAEAARASTPVFRDDSSDEEYRGSGRRRRSRKKKTRASSLPSSAQRSMSRVREYELWREEAEAIRIAQVEMERRLDEEKEEHQREAARLEAAQLGLDWHEEEEIVFKQKVGSRKPTPRFLVSSPASEDETDWRSNGRRSATTSMASTSSPPPGLADFCDFEELNRRSERQDDRKGDERRRNKHTRRDPPPPRAPSPPTRPPSRRSKPPLSRSSSLPPQPSSIPSSSSRSSRRAPRPPDYPSYSASSQPSSGLSSLAPPPSSTSRRSRSSRNRPRPSPSLSSNSPSPARTPRSPGKPASVRLSDDEGEGEKPQDLLQATAEAGRQAVEQVGEAVSTALSKVLPSLFAGRT